MAKACENVYFQMVAAETPPSTGDLDRPLRGIRMRQDAIVQARDTPARPIANVPVEIGPTTARRHLTGSFALNIPNAPLSHGGDWHSWNAWYAAERETVRETGFTNEEEYGPLLDRIGGRGLRDVRPGLKRLQHPASSEREKIWAATYDRAALEIAWRELRRYGPHSDTNVCAPVNRDDLRRWLLYPHQWLRLRWMAWQLRKDLKGENLEQWDAWRRSWSA